MRTCAEPEEGVGQGGSGGRGGVKGQVQYVCCGGNWNGAMSVRRRGGETGFQADLEAI